MYRDSRFEVHLEPLPKGTEIEAQVSEGEEGECLDCFEGFEDQYKIIFTRPGKDSTRDDDDLF
ncbi:hypothetical protein ACFL0H_02345 [Thermodesulfobacteriota bacterium]